jgi:hypothetical protein
MIGFLIESKQAVEQAKKAGMKRLPQLRRSARLLQNTQLHLYHKKAMSSGE